MKVLFVSFYNNYVVGSRSIAAFLKSRGHDPRFIHLKALYLTLVSRKDRERLHAFREEHPLGSISVHEEGDLLVPDLQPITEMEEGLFIAELNRDPPDVVGFSVGWDSLPCFQRFANRVREHFPGMPTIAGGPPAVTSPQTLVPFVDAVCTGEGEHAMAEWLGDPERTDLPGLWFNKKEGTMRNPRRAPVRDPDALPFPLYGYDELLIENDSVSRKLETVPEYIRDKWVFLSRRGWPGGCALRRGGYSAILYPDHGVTPRRSVSHFIGEIKEATGRLPFETIPIYDNCFAAEEEWLDEFCERYRREIGLPFRFSAYPGLTTPRMLERLREAGACNVMVTGQRAVAMTSGEMGRSGPEAETIRKTIVEAVHSGIERVHCDLLANSPCDSENDLRSAFAFLLDLPEHFYCDLNHLLVYPDTEMFQPDSPRPALSEPAHRFWNLLLLLSRYPNISRRGLERISRDSGIKRSPELLDEFLYSYVRRARYLGKSILPRFRAPRPDSGEVGCFPLTKHLLQNRFPYACIRAKMARGSRGAERPFPETHQNV